MEFIKSINLVRKRLPFPFYMQLIVIPATLTFMFWSAPLVAKEEAGDWVNIYSITTLSFMGWANLCFWKKLHWQRLGDPVRARDWANRTHWMAGAILIALLGSGA